VKFLNAINDYATRFIYLSIFALYAILSCTTLENLEM